jgi:hypothetical protein
MNPNRPTKNEVRKQTKAANQFAGKQKTKVINPELWRLVCPKASR